MKKNASAKGGMSEMLLLALLAKEDMYGYQLCQELTVRTDAVFVMQEGTVYPILYRLVQKGLISAHRELVGKRRTRVYYHLEPKGIQCLDVMKENYLSTHRSIAKLLELPA